jgi:hypothetical protein
MTCSSSFLFPCVLDFLTSRTTVSYTSIAVAEAGIAPIKLVPIPEYKARQPSSRKIVSSVLIIPLFRRGNLFHNFLVLQPFSLRGPLPHMNGPPPSLALACSIGAKGYTFFCVCNLVRTTSCGYVAIVAHALLAELAVSTPRI